MSAYGMRTRGAAWRGRGRRGDAGPAPPEEEAALECGLKLEVPSVGERRIWRERVGDYQREKRRILGLWERARRAGRRWLLFADVAEGLAGAQAEAFAQLVYRYLQDEGCINSWAASPPRAVRLPEGVPVEDVLTFRAAEILATADLEVVTSKAIRRQMEKDLGTDLEARKGFVKGLVGRFLDADDPLTLDGVLEAPPKGMERGMFPEKKGKAVVVVGAGPAGLSAACHLTRQGCDVTVLEGRERIGGRVFTDRTSLSVPVDLGASIVTGTKADLAEGLRPDPSALLCRLHGLTYHDLDAGNCPLYDGVTGKAIDEATDRKVEEWRDELMSEARMQVDKLGEEATNALSLGNEIERLVAKGADEEAGKKRRAAAIIEDSDEEDEGPAAGGPAPDDRAAERRLLDWHWANLEYGCSAELNQISLANWNQDDDFGGFGGPHSMIKEGYGRVLETLAEGLDVVLGAAVSQIRYEDGAEGGGVSVTTADGTVRRADAVVVTVPLGCLKANAIEFVPRLPEWKTDAIANLGFGNLNKVVIEFPEGTPTFEHCENGTGTVDFFGLAQGGGPLGRGRAFFIWNLRPLSGKPVFIALMAGAAAAETDDEAAAVKATLAALERVFGKDKVPEPRATVVSKWGSDPFALGSYSFVAKGSSGKDYDTLGLPVKNKVFFAGEHTCKEYPDTVGGAMLTGLRSAKSVLAVLCGEPSYLPDEALKAEAKGEGVAGEGGPSDGAREESDDEGDEEDEEEEEENELQRYEREQDAKRRAEEESRKAKEEYTAIHTTMDGGQASLADVTRLAETVVTDGGQRVLLQEMLQLRRETLAAVGKDLDLMRFLNDLLETRAGRLKDGGVPVVSLVLRILAKVPVDKAVLKSSGIAGTVRTFLRQHNPALEALRKGVIRHWAASVKAQAPPPAKPKPKPAAEAAPAPSKGTAPAAEPEVADPETLRIRAEVRAAKEEAARLAQELQASSNPAPVNKRPLFTTDFDEFHKKEFKKKRTKELIETELRRADTLEEEKPAEAPKPSGRELKLIVSEYVRKVLQPSFKSGLIDKESFKNISRKATDKVVKNHKDAKGTQDFLTASRMQAIEKLVAAYVDRARKSSK